MEYNKNVENNRTQSGEKFIASMDIESLYPSLKTEDSVQIVREVITTSELEVEGIDIREICIFLRINLSNGQINSSGHSFLQKRRGLKLPVKTKRTKRIMMIYGHFLI